MCGDIGMRYGPEIRFYYSERIERIEEAEQEINLIAPELTKKYLYEDHKIEKLSKREFQFAVEEMKDELIFNASESITNEDKLK